MLNTLCRQLESVELCDPDAHDGKKKYHITLNLPETRKREETEIRLNLFFFS